MLDEELRRRLSDAAERAEEPGLESKANARAIGRMMAEEMARVRARRRTLGAVAILCAAAGVAFVLGRTTAPVEQPVAEAPAPRCATLALSRAPFALTNATRDDADARFRLATAEGSVVRVDARAACASHLTLEAGHVDVWARALSGGTLDVRAGSTRVEVVGTRFRVARDGAAVLVHVGEGRVRVHHAGGTTYLSADQSGRFDGVATLLPLPADVRAALDALVESPRAEHVVTQPVLEAVTGAEPPRAAHAESEAPESAASSDALVLEAERAMREGRLDDARSLFRRAGRSATATGEAAWIRLARLELRAGRPRDARRAIAEHDARFRAGRLAAEALYVDALAARALGDEAAAANAEARLRERFPESPQAARVRAARSGE